MKNLVLVRNEELALGENLSINSIQELVKLAVNQVDPLLEEDSSTAVMVAPIGNGAHAISGLLNIIFARKIPIISNERLWAHSNHERNLRYAFDLVMSMKETDIVILIVGSEYMTDFPRYYSKRVLGQKVFRVKYGKKSPEGQQDTRVRERVQTLSYRK